MKENERMYNKKAPCLILRSNPSGDRRGSKAPTFSQLSSLRLPEVCPFTPYSFSLNSNSHISLKTSNFQNYLPLLNGKTFKTFYSRCTIIEKVKKTVFRSELMALFEIDQ